MGNSVSQAAKNTGNSTSQLLLKLNGLTRSLASAATLEAAHVAVRDKLGMDTIKDKINLLPSLINNNQIAKAEVLANKVQNDLSVMISKLEKEYKTSNVKEKRQALDMRVQGAKLHFGEILCAKGNLELAKTPPNITEAQKCFSEGKAFLDKISPEDNRKLPNSFTKAADAIMQNIKEGKKNGAY